MLKPRLLLALDVGATKVACATGRVVPLGRQPAGWGPSLGSGEGAASVGRHPAGCRHSLGSGEGAASVGGVEVLGVGVAEYAAPNTAWPCEPSVLARTIEQALERAGAEEPLDRAWVTLSHPDCAHHRVTVDLDLAEEPVLVRERDLARLGAQAISHSLPLDRELLLLAPIGYAGLGFEDVKSPHGLSTTKLRGSFHLVSLPSAVKRAVVDAVHAVGLEPDRVGYSLHAAAAACLDESLRRQRCWVVDVGGFSLHAGLFSQGALERAWTMPWGGRRLEMELAQAAPMTVSQALSHALEGWTGSTPAVRETLARQAEPVRAQLHAIAALGPTPDVAVVTGRGALIDGMVEWIGDCLGVKAVLGRSPHVRSQRELSDQVALTAAVGALSALGSSPVGPAPAPSTLVERIIDRTRRILVDYF